MWNRAAETMPREQLERLQVQRLREAVARVAQAVPFYAQRTLLKSEVLPERVAAAIFALVAGDLSLTTGMLVPVDGGVPSAFLR